MRLRRAPAEDALVRDAEAAVLIDGTLVRLSGVGTFVYVACGRPMTSEAIAMALAEEFGVPEGRSAKHAAEEVIQDLLAHGVLRETT